MVIPASSFSDYFNLLGFRHLQLRDDQVHVPLIVRAAEIAMVLILNRLEVYHSVSNDLCGVQGCGIRASHIICAREHGDWHLINACDVDQLGFTLAVQIVGSPLLEAVRVGVLPPVCFGLDALWLTPVA